jgi:EAL domain-containing protein (putative c-di-GMP-specific phosphodiesterase class I)
LRQLGCDEGQGFFLSRPVAAAEIDRCVDGISSLELELLGEPVAADAS